MKELTKFFISEKIYLLITPEPMKKDECEICAMSDIDYIDEEKNICIRFGYIETDEFCYKIIESGFTQSLLHNKKQLDTSITEDVGFEANEFFANKRGSTKADKYHWFSNSHKHIRPFYNSWLYNDEKGNIIFEITPFYPWFYETKKTHPEKISYKKWIQNYKPTVKIKIPKKNIKQWIKQAKELKKIYIDDRA